MNNGTIELHPDDPGPTPPPEYEFYVGQRVEVEEITVIDSSGRQLRGYVVVPRV